MAPTQIQFALPEFRGLTRRLVLCNLATFFVLLILLTARILSPVFVLDHFAFSPRALLAGEIWQPFLCSFIQLGLWSTAWAMLTLWFLGSMLEDWHGTRWFGWLYAFSIFGWLITATLVYAGMRLLAPAHDAPNATLYGCGGGLFGLLIAIGVLHGEVEFRLFFLVLVKAKYLAIIAALIALAMAFGDAPIYALSDLGAGLAAFIYLRKAPRRGIDFNFSERFYGLRNQYYRWKRKKAASKFEVYMKKQGRTVRFDGQGRPLDDDRDDHNDRKRWN